MKEENRKTCSLLIGVYIGLLIYSMKIPGTSVAIYKVLSIAAIFPALAYCYFTRQYCSHSLQTGWILWTLMGILGILLIPLTWRNGVDADQILWLFCMAASMLELSAYAEKGNGMEQILFWYFLISIAIGILGFYEAFTGNIINKTTGSYYYRRNSLGLTAPNTIFYNINDHAVFMAFSLFISWLFASGKKQENVIKAVSIFVFLGNIILVGSRGAFIASILFFLLLFIQEGKNSVRKSIFEATLIFFLFVFLMLIIFGVVSLDLSSENRLQIWQNTWDSLRESLFLGVGAGNIKSINHTSFSRVIADPHNFFLELFADYGFAGFIFTVSWFVILTREAKELGRMDRKGQIVYDALLCFLPLSIVSSSLVGKSWVICFFAVLTAQVNRLHQAYLFSGKEAVCEKDPCFTGCIRT